MTVDEIRRKNLELVRSAANASWKELAKKCGVSPSYFSQIRSGHRAFTEKTARMLEAKLRLTTGMLDRVDNSALATSQPTDAELLASVHNALKAALGALSRDLSPERLAEVATVLYEDAKKRGSLDAEHVGRLVRLLSYERTGTPKS